jgi:hypothetical protein
MSAHGRSEGARQRPRTEPSGAWEHADQLATGRKRRRTRGFSRLSKGATEQIFHIRHVSLPASSGPNPSRIQGSRDAAQISDASFADGVDDRQGVGSEQFRILGFNLSSQCSRLWRVALVPSRAPPAFFAAKPSRSAPKPAGVLATRVQRAGAPSKAIGIRRPAPPR